MGERNSRREEERARVKEREGVGRRGKEREERQGCLRARTVETRQSEGMRGGGTEATQSLRQGRLSWRGSGKGKGKDGVKPDIPCRNEDQSPVSAKFRQFQVKAVVLCQVHATRSPCCSESVLNPCGSKEEKR